MGYFERTVEFLGRIDLGQTKILRPRSLVFLCGGKANPGDVVTSSAREALLRRLPDRGAIGQSAILLAERANEALADTAFDNLLDLEECIASIVDAVVLIVESAGSICELGAFTKTEEIRRRLMAIVLNEHHVSTSFIRLGPLRYLESGESQIYPFHWVSVDGGVHVEDYVLDEMISEIIDAVKKVPTTELLNTKSVGHRVYLTLAFAHILRGGRIGEIRDCFDAIGVDVSEKEVRKYLNTLEICGLLRTVGHGKHRTHYVPRVERVALDIVFKEDTSDRDRNALRWLRAIAQDLIEEDPVRVRIFREHNDAA